MGGVSTTDEILNRFAQWFGEAEHSEPNDPGAAALATADPARGPDVRMVLLRAFDARGFVFYTNRQSAKGRQLAVWPRAALSLHWKSLRRQVRLAGPVTPVTDAESDAYFAQRPRESQISAWASRQSEPLADRAAFEAELAAMERRFEGVQVPRPPEWGGYRIAPGWIEFWEDRRGRRHVRERYDRTAGSSWTHTLLYP